MSIAISTPHFIDLSGVVIELVNCEQHAGLMQFYQRHRDKEIHATEQNPQLILGSDVDDNKPGLSLTWHQTGQTRSPRSKQKSLSYYLDFVKTAARLRSFPAPKQGAFNQALGKKTKRLIDASGGWGGDALLMCLQAYQVTVIERQPVMALLLEDAFARLANSDWARNHGLSTPVVINDNALSVLSVKELSADCIYFDPMFPAKHKQSAAVNKYMQLLQDWVGEDVDAGDVLTCALESYPRVVVKRPHYAQALSSSSLNRLPDAQFSSKLVHYDVYHR